jgi:hypothetical protein
VISPQSLDATEDEPALEAEIVCGLDAGPFGGVPLGLELQYFVGILCPPLDAAEEALGALRRSTDLGRRIDERVNWMDLLGGREQLHEVVSLRPPEQAPRDASAETERTRARGRRATASRPPSRDGTISCDRRAIR